VRCNLQHDSRDRLLSGVDLATGDVIIKSLLDHKPRGNLSTSDAAAAEHARTCIYSGCSDLVRYGVGVRNKVSGSSFASITLHVFAYLFPSLILPNINALM
jgi:hypothetical protein